MPFAADTPETEVFEQALSCEGLCFPGATTHEDERSGRGQKGVDSLFIQEPDLVPFNRITLSDDAFCSDHHSTIEYIDVYSWLFPKKLFGCCFTASWLGS